MENQEKRELIKGLLEAVDMWDKEETKAALKTMIKENLEQKTVLEIKSIITQLYGVYR